MLSAIWQNITFIRKRGEGMKIKKQEEMLKTKKFKAIIKEKATFIDRCRFI